MGYGPELIIDENDRLKTSVGNWVAFPAGEENEFRWNDGSAEIFQGESTSIAIDGILNPDFFNPIKANKSYRLSFWAMIPTGSPGTGYGFLMVAGESGGGGIVFHAPPYDTWVKYEDTQVMPNEVDHEMSYLDFYAYDLPPNASIYVRDLSIREVLVGKIQYLPLMGAG